MLGSKYQETLETLIHLKPKTVVNLESSFCCYSCKKRIQDPEILAFTLIKDRSRAYFFMHPSCYEILQILEQTAQPM